MNRYKCQWRHGPAPGLTYYSGEVFVYADNTDDAEHKAKRDVTREWSFSPGCVTITKIEEVTVR